jgi:hypothetical protein
MRILGRYIGFIGIKYAWLEIKGVLMLGNLKSFKPRYWISSASILKMRLWRLVLVHKFGEYRGGIEVGGRMASTWWKDIVDVKTRSFNEIENWFDNFLFRKSFFGMTIGWKKVLFLGSTSLV